MTVFLLLSACAAADRNVRESEETAAVAQEEVRTPRVIMADATVELEKLISLSGFDKYASKESFALLLIYLQMQNACTAGDMPALLELERLYYPAAQRAGKITVGLKQKYLQNLERDVNELTDDIEKQGETRIFEVYPTIYLVKRGDTLPGIAARHEIYNDSFMWPLIYKANRDQIKDPKTIYAGQDLKIPREMTMEEIIAPRREAGAPDPETIPKDAYLPKNLKK